MDVSSINSFLQALMFMCQKNCYYFLAWFVISLQILYKDYKKNANKDN